jgi:hypothetical protein
LCHRCAITVVEAKQTVHGANECKSPWLRKFPVPLLRVYLLIHLAAIQVENTLCC